MTIKVKTAELSGDALNWAVDKCEGFFEFAPKNLSDTELFDWWWERRRDYSRDWARSGPIIEREKIGVTFHDERDEWEVPNWGAWPTQTDDRQEIMGETPLIAAMRCYVASKLGYEVDVPEELS